MKDTYVIGEDHWSSPVGCHEDCPACEGPVKNKHTPGPWEVTESGNIVSGFPFHLIASVQLLQMDGCSPLPQAANAALIAAAPDLADALYYALSVIESLTQFEMEKLEDRLDEDIDFHRMTQALAKAKGK